MKKKSTVGETKTIRPTFDNEYTDCDMLEILRDISLFICARGMDRHGEHGKNTKRTSLAYSCQKTPSPTYASPADSLRFHQIENALAELPPGASSWVSAGKNLITPTSAQNFQRLNYARVVRAKFPVSNSAALLNGLDGHVYNWTVETTGQWLLNNGYEDTVQCFKDNDITGDVLLDLTHDTLKDMGMHSTGRRIRLLKMIAELRLHVADLTIQEATDEAQAQELEGLAIH
ncbi:unnamed protein product [Mortierella alpina]